MLRKVSSLPEPPLGVLAREIRERLPACTRGPGDITRH